MIPSLDFFFWSSMESSMHDVVNGVFWWSGFILAFLALLAFTSIASLFSLKVFTTAIGLWAEWCEWVYRRDEFKAFKKWEKSADWSDEHMAGPLPVYGKKPYRNGMRDPDGDLIELGEVQGLTEEQARDWDKEIVSWYEDEEEK